MSNRLPDQIDRLFTLAEDMIDGLAAAGAAAGVAQNTAPVLQGALDAARSAEAAFQAARAAKIARTAEQTVADSNGKAFIAGAKRLLANYLGGQWGAAWAQAGFANGSLETPAALGERQSLLAALRDYFAAHAAQENAPLGLTAAAAVAVFDALSAARAAVHAALQALGQARDGREAAVEALRRRMRGLVTELETLLEDADPRWYAFGLNAPGDPATPGIPEGLVLTAGAPGAGTLFADWADSRRAARYRVWLRKPGEADFSPAATVSESDALLTGLPAGAPLTLRVTAANDAGESLPGAEAAITLS